MNHVKHDAVFISDLHLHPEMPVITERFRTFVQWAVKSTKSVYILGDFFHVWPGDEGLNAWSEEIAAQLAWLAKQNVRLYFMVGNRDFLLGKKFFQEANLIELSEPSVIQLGNQSVLLTHGDRYCTRDKSHQYLRILTRNRVFKTLFLKLPYHFRDCIVNRVRQHSQTNRYKPVERMAVVASAVISHLNAYQVDCLIHGHTHQPGLSEHTDKYRKYQRYVLSDWDENPLILCYNKTNNFKFELLGSCYGR